MIESDQEFTNRAGTRAYMAPEVAARQPTDVFSFGCVVLFTLTGQNPPQEGILFQLLRILPKPKTYHRLSFAQLAHV